MLRLQLKLLAAIADARVCAEIKRLRRQTCVASRHWQRKLQGPHKCLEVNYCHEGKEKEEEQEQETVNISWTTAVNVFGTTITTTTTTIAQLTGQHWLHVGVKTFCSKVLEIFKSVGFSFSFSSSSSSNSIFCFVSACNLERHRALTPYLWCLDLYLFSCIWAEVLSWACHAP